ncbi:hypothetical protein SGLAU_26920 [Streptomyces glaucescens]|uniref:Alpha/beta hydrolase n=1 Tax=Streptomyces glaucescens TaxID=1907 RepID=A0A089XHC8_STRGA|nr:hypothetical protein SGLAU_26920 [Streptomyces glaucescens]
MSRECTGHVPAVHRTRRALQDHRRLTSILAASQHPLAAGAFDERAIDPEAERFGAERAGATIVGLEGASHAVAVSRPREVADLIRDAVRATSRRHRATGTAPAGSGPAFVRERVGRAGYVSL